MDDGGDGDDEKFEGALGVAVRGRAIRGAISPAVCKICVPRVFLCVPNLAPYVRIFFVFLVLHNGQQQAINSQPTIYIYTFVVYAALFSLQNGKSNAGVLL